MSTTGVTAAQAADYLEFVTPLSVQFLPAFFKLAAVQPGERVLDVACGPGDTTFEAADAVVPLRPHAADARPFRYGPSGVLSRILADAGYSDVTPDRTSASLEYADSAAYWQAIERGLAYGPAPLAGLTPAHRAAAQEAGEPGLRKWRNPRTRRLHLPAQAFCAVAVK